jgi:hypothetical protein
MQERQLEVYSEVTNSGIVRMPGRRFPGVVLQGDTLSILFYDAIEIFERVRNTTDEDLYLTTLGIAQQLKAHLLNYETVLREHGIDLPYARSIQTVKLPE